MKNYRFDKYWRAAIESLIEPGRRYFARWHISVIPFQYTVQHIYIDYNLVDCPPPFRIRDNFDADLSICHEPLFWPLLRYRACAHNVRLRYAPVSQPTDREAISYYGPLNTEAKAVLLKFPHYMPDNRMRVAKTGCPYRATISPCRRHFAFTRRSD
jgi:hypothetical protein